MASSDWIFYGVLFFLAGLAFANRIPLGEYRYELISAVGGGAVITGLVSGVLSNPIPGKIQWVVFAAIAVGLYFALVKAGVTLSRDLGGFLETQVEISHQRRKNRKSLWQRIRRKKHAVQE